MESFYRSKKESVVLTVFGFMVLFILATLFTMVGFLQNLSELDYGRLFFGIIGLAFFCIFLRGCWLLQNGRDIHFFSMDAEVLSWGYGTKIERVAVADIAELYFDTSDGCSCAVSLMNGSRKRVQNIELSMSYKSHDALMDYLVKNHPSIVLTGNHTSALKAG